MENLKQDVDVCMCAVKKNVEHAHHSNNMNYNVQGIFNGGNH